MTTQKTGNKRLLALADLLEKLPRRRFEYARWVGTSWKGKQDLSCGTTACALGWAATMPSLRRAGLRLMPSTEYADGFYHGVVALKGDRYATNSSPYEAAKEVFAIDYAEAYHLFNPSYNMLEESATPKQVAKHIRLFVAVRSAR